VALARCYVRWRAGLAEVAIWPCHWRAEVVSRCYHRAVPFRARPETNRIVSSFHFISGNSGVK
jgi:hypothetical protein